ncbi:SMI1/KNR4 family protein [Flavobacterium sp. JAS]|uniref:SMI1/KNR4 family protein n=1 Tax=Flavobacterium sp. JAS TaxID=2897329 RepID=UPI001E5A63BE|nr:SMI1/KNR4 family protein [Flavobacterium sp. JAS]MCD0469992.1 SMI1/KNR4 family protein [Flavobacterium sp. JAS]
MNYTLEKEFLKKIETSSDETNRKEIITDEQIKTLLEKYPKIPKDYIDYLQEIGSGNFRECQFKVQPFLFNLEDLGLEDHYELKSNIWFFGDNYCGDFSGFDFDSDEGTVVEFWHESGDLYYTQKTFQNYIRERMEMDENGNQKV